MKPVTLYKKDSKGKIRFFTIVTEGSEIVQQSGIVGTDSPVEHRKTAKAKNVGRSNETTPEEQAISEAESTISKKLDKGYFDTKDEAENEEVILPMLAKSFDKHEKKVDWDSGPVAQPKLDGMRCLCVIRSGSVKLLSRGGKEIETMEHIKDDMKGLNDMVLDGELYAHGESFQENMKLIKKYRPGESEYVKLHAYDIISDESFKTRYQKLTKISSTLSEVRLVENKVVYSKEELQEIHGIFLNEGYEGSILRHSDKGYKVNGRCDSLLKFKDFIDIALPIMDIVPGDQRPEEGYPTFYWEGAVDDTLTTGMKFSHEERKEFLRNKDKYIGKTAEIRFFEYSDTGVPRFPVCVGLRLDK